MSIPLTIPSSLLRVPERSHAYIAHTYNGDTPEPLTTARRSKDHKEWTTFDRLSACDEPGWFCIDFCLAHRSQRRKAKGSCKGGGRIILLKLHPSPTEDSWDRLGRGNADRPLLPEGTYQGYFLIEVSLEYDMATVDSWFVDNKGRKSRKVPDALPKRVQVCPSFNILLQ